MLSIMQNFLSFAFFKGIVFFSVLFYSYLGFTTEYIQLEQGIALATMITPFLVFGLTTSFSHYKITKRTNKFDWVYWEHLKFVIYILTPLSVVFIMLGWGHQHTIILLTLFVFSRFYSQPFKTENNVFYSSFIDSIPYIFISVCLLLITLNVNMSLALNIVFYTVVIFIIYLVNKKVHRLKNNDKAEAIVFYTFGGKAFLVSAIIVAIMMLPRAFAHLIVNETEIEDFFLALRYASIGVLIYQFISIKLFSYIYKMEGKVVLIGAIAIYIAAFCFITIGLSVLSYIKIISTIKFNYLAALITAIWITSSFLEYFVSKSNSAKLFTKICLLFVIPISFLLNIAVEPVYIQYLVVISLASVVISQLIAVFYKKPVYAILSTSIIVCSLLIFGMFYV